MECIWKKRGCGGCISSDKDYSTLLSDKQRWVEQLLGEYGSVNKIIGADDPFNYRCKVISSFGSNGKKLINGLYAKNSHRIIPVDSCQLEDKDAAKAVAAAATAAAKCRYSAFDEDKNTGLVRHLLVRKGAATGELMVVLVTAQDILPGSKNFVKYLRELCPEVTTVVQNINPKKTSAVLSNRFKTLWGPGFIKDELCGCRFIISPASFYQVNPAQTEKLYSLAVQSAQLNRGKTALDAYCGTGTIGIVAAKSSGCSIIGVESNKAAVGDAVKNARANGISSARFIAADAGEFLNSLAAENQKPDVLFMDPPRAGSDEKFLSSVVGLCIQRVVYISCNPETQRRDVDFLTKRGYTVTNIQPVDLFPFTEHVECIVTLVSNKHAK